jgi:hypothetical protein
MTATTAKARMPSKGATRVPPMGEENTGSGGAAGANHSPSGSVSQWGPDRSMGSDWSGPAAGSAGGG